MQLQNKSFIERIVHAVGFEAIAVMICAPLGAWLLNRSMVQIGALAVMLSTVAMVWNMIYNTVFDRLWPVSRVARNLKVRVFHALGFEAGFVLIGVPIAAWMLSISFRPLCWRLVSSCSSCRTPCSITGCTTRCVSAGSRRASR